MDPDNHTICRRKLFLVTAPGQLLTLLLAMSILLASLSVCRAEGSKSGQDPEKDMTGLSVEELMKFEVTYVYGASKYAQKVTEAPSSVSIVTAEEIRQYGCRTLADVLRSVRGFYITYDRNYNYIGIRGFNRPGDYNSRILLLVDGHRINDNVYDTAPIGTEFPLDLDLVDRIEIIRGPSSSLYGASAFFGVINVITRNGLDLQGVEIAGSAGSFSTYTGRLSYGNETAAGLDILLSTSLMTSDGPDRLFFREYAAPATSNGTAAEADDDRNVQIFSKLGFRDLTLTGSYSSREKGIPTGSFGTVFNDSRTRTTDGSYYLDLRYAHLFTDRTEASARMSYNRYSYHGDYLYERSNPGDPPRQVLNKDLADGYWWGGEAQVTGTLFDRHKLTAGGEFRSNGSQHQSNYDLSPHSVYLDDTRSSSIWAVFVQDELPLAESLTVSAGVRYDHYQSFGGTVNPRLALNYRPLPATVFKLLYGEAFRAPNVFEFYYNDGGQTTESNLDLNPEKIRTLELVYEQYLGEHFRSSLSGFYYRISDLIGQTIDPANGLIQFNNSGTAESRGAEVELEGKWPGGLQSRFSYSFQQTRDLESDVRLSNSPRHLAKFNLLVPLISDRLVAGLEHQYTGSRKTLANREADAFAITNLTLSGHELYPGVTLSASVYNLFDTEYGDPGAAEHLQEIIEQDGRTFRIKLTCVF